MQNIDDNTTEDTPNRVHERHCLQVCASYVSCLVGAMCVCVRARLTNCDDNAQRDDGISSLRTRWRAHDTKSYAIRLPLMGTCEKRKIKLKMYAIARQPTIEPTATQSHR